MCVFYCLFRVALKRCHTLLTYREDGFVPLTLGHTGERVTCPFWSFSYSDAIPEKVRFNKSPFSRFIIIIAHRYDAIIHKYYQNQLPNPILLLPSQLRHHKTHFIIPIWSFSAYVSLPLALICTLQIVPSSSHIIISSILKTTKTSVSTYQ